MTLPRREEEPVNPSYAAAGKFRKRWGSCKKGRTEDAQAAWSRPEGGGRELMMSGFFLWEKSWSETRETAVGAVVIGSLC